MEKILIKNATIINESRIFESDILISNGRIAKIDSSIKHESARIIDAEGKYVIPGVIDDQVHFREPGLEYKATIASESRAGIYGGVTSFMDMPNNDPPVLDQMRLSKKYDIASDSSFANYSFYMGASNDNIEELLKTDFSSVCGIKIFMGSSTGNMLVDDQKTLEDIFSKYAGLIATHCEDESTIKMNYNAITKEFGQDITAEYHPLIRDHKSCILSSKYAVDLAKKHGSRLHVLHLTTADEMGLFESDTPLPDKKITAEVCVHHLYFNTNHYAELGNKIKCNPAIKTENDRLGLWQALLGGKIDVIATDHAPHTLEEKNRRYIDSPSGLPLVQHSLNLMLEFYRDGLISLEQIVEKMCHNPAIAFRIIDRGFIREGYWADIVMIDKKRTFTVNSDNIAYKCGWSPLEGKYFHYYIDTVLVNGELVLENGTISGRKNTQKLLFYPL
jgi:dihydroorotase